MSAPRHAVPRVLALSPPAPGPWVAELEGLVQAGVTALVLRLLDAPDALEALLAGPLPSGLSVLVRPVRAHDAAPAQARGLGLHLPSSWPPSPWRAGTAGLLGASCHDLDSLRRAALAGCDLALLAPVASPGSKPLDRRPVLGLPGLRRLVCQVDLPVLALGGVDPALAAACVAAGAHGVAGIGAFFRGGHVDADSAAALVAAVDAAVDAATKPSA